MSGSPTFDTEKKNRNGGILRLRLAYGRRSNYTPYYTRITFLTRSIRYVIHFPSKISHRYEYRYNSKCRSSEQNVLRTFSNPLEHLVTIGSSLLLPYTLNTSLNDDFSVSLGS